MTDFILRLLYGLSLLAVAFPLLARAATPELCTAAPRSGWISWMEVESRLRESGLRMVQLRISDHRCYEVVGLDSHGELHGYRMDPVTGKIIGPAAKEDVVRGMPWRFGRSKE